MIVFAALAIFQVALVVRAELAVVHAAREAARTASVDPDPDRARASARRVAPGASVNVGRRGRVGDPIDVDVRLHFVTSLPLVGPLFPDPTLHARAVMRIER